MSRVEKENAEYMIAFGADHATGTFCQVWKQPHEEQDEPLVGIDNFGVRTDGRALPDDVRRLLDEVKERYDISKRRGIPRPNIDAETVAKLFALYGFKDMAGEVFRAFD